MNISPTLQQNPHWEASDLLFTPYQEGLKFCEEGVSIPEKLVGVALLIPLANVIVFIALKSFAFYQMMNELSQWEDGRNSLPGSPDTLAVEQIQGCMGGGDILDLDHYALRTLPNCLGRLTHLTSIMADDNQLQELPETLGNIQKLQTLFLSDNHLGAISNELAQKLVHLPNFQTFDASDNAELQEFPEAFGQMPPSKIYQSYLHRD